MGPRWEKTRSSRGFPAALGTWAKPQPLIDASVLQS
jgi:hypothetical protein